MYAYNASDVGKGGKSRNGNGDGYTSEMNQTGLVNPGDGSHAELSGDMGTATPGMRATKLKEDDGPSLGNPLDYDFEDLLY